MPDKRSTIRRAAALAAAGAGLLALTACGGGRDHDPAGHGAHSPAAVTASPGRPDAADVAFAVGMIPHHRQAVEMAALAPSGRRPPRSSASPRRSRRPRTRRSPPCPAG